MSTKTTYLMKRILFGGLLLLLFVPQLQKRVFLIKEQNLEGAFSPTPDITLSKGTWFAGEYQENKSAFLSENFGFRKSLVRGHNECRYRLFDATNARGVVVGKSDVLYESWYIRSALGLDFMGNDALKTKVKKLAAVRDTLESLGKDLLVVLAPGKGSFFPDNYPEN